MGRTACTEPQCLYKGALLLCVCVCVCVCVEYVVTSVFRMPRCLSFTVLTYIPTPWYRVLLEKLTGLQLVKKFPAFHGTRRFITALSSVRHLSLSWASPIQSIYPHPTPWRSVLILSTHLRLGLPSGLFPSGFPTKTLYTPSPHPYAPHAQPISLFSFSSSLRNLLHSPVTSSLLGPNILLNTKFSNTLSFLSFRRANDQVSHPYKTTGKIIVLYIATPRRKPGSLHGRACYWWCYDCD